MNNDGKLKLVLVGGAVLLLIGVLPLPYAYYNFLRLAVTGIAVAYLVLVSVPAQDKVGNYISGGIAVLYNPLLPVYLNKPIWVVLNLLTAAAFVYCALRKQPQISTNE